MKSTKHFLSSVVLLMVLVFSVQAHAALDLIGQGTSAHGTYNLIYDTDLNITWYDYSNAPDTWFNQGEWASALTVNIGGNIYDDWSLPVSATCRFSDCTGSNMGHLFYTELGNSAGGPISSTGDFQNIIATRYWSGTESSLNWAWRFDFSDGNQNNQGAFSNLYALAVMDGMAVAPEPVSSTLFVIGSVTLGLRRFRKKFEK